MHSSDIDALMEGAVVERADHATYLGIGSCWTANFREALQQR